MNAIRAMNAATGRRVDVLGHSQGGMVPRWALRFWPDTRAMVDDQIGMAPSNHGTDSAVAALQRSRRLLRRRLAAGQRLGVHQGPELLPGDIRRDRLHGDLHQDGHGGHPEPDETGSSSLRPGDGPNITNVAIQDVCPPDVSDHLAIGTTSNTAYALVIDAMDNPGPADPARVPIATCAITADAGGRPAHLPADAADAATAPANSYATAPRLAAEPPLACYVFAACGSAIPAASVNPPEMSCAKKKGKKRKAAGKKKGKAAAKKKGKKRRACKPKKKQEEEGQEAPLAAQEPPPGGVRLDDDIAARVGPRRRHARPRRASASVSGAGCP